MAKPNPKPWASRRPAGKRAKADPAKAPIDTIVIDDPPMTISLRRTAAARRLSLTFSQIDGAARLTMPRHCARSVAEGFVNDHRDWLRDALTRTAEPVILGPDAVIPFRGAPCRIERSDRRGVRFEGPDRLLVGGAEATIGPRIAVWLKDQARGALLAASQRYAATLGVDFERIVIRDTRSRWGSCSSSGTLSYSWRLIFAPVDVLDYVAAHEVAHLIEMNHSSRFWAVVEQLRPDWRAQRDWLRHHGSELHRYRITA